jgi:alpha-1,2-mannosyltransferase
VVSRPNGSSVVLRFVKRGRGRRADLLGDLAVLLAIVAFCRGANLVHTLSNHELFVDLDVYRMGGRGILDGQALYDLHLPSINLPFTYTPFAAIFFIPLSMLQHDPAVIVWASVTLLVLLRICWILAAEVRRCFGGTWPVALLAFGLSLVALELEPVLETIAFGQVNLLIMWFVLEDVLRRKPNRASGVLIGLATGIKLVPGLFIVFLLITRRTREAVTAGITTLATIALGFVVQPGEAWRYWTGIAYDGGRMGDISYVGNQSINGALYRFLPPDGSRVLWLALSMPVVAVALWAARRLWLHDVKLLAVSTVGLGTLLVSPIAWSHHWIWLLVILAALLDPAVAPRIPRLLALAGTFVVTTVHFLWSFPRGLIWSVPNSGGVERSLEGYEKYLANAYVWLGVALLVLIVVTARRAGPDARQGLDDPSGDDGATLGNEVDATFDTELEDELDALRAHANEPAERAGGLGSEDDPQIVTV